MNSFQELETIKKELSDSNKQLDAIKIELSDSNKQLDEDKDENKNKNYILKYNNKNYEYNKEDVPEYFDINSKNSK